MQSQKESWKFEIDLDIFSKHKLMNQIVSYSLIAVYAIFLGSQITEACLLVPYWKSLPMIKFYEYYSVFGIIIGKFYTILTIIAILIPIGVCSYCITKKHSALNYSLLATFFSILVIVLFYAYFKDVNKQFYTANLNAMQLESELEIWSYWHWCRIILELLSLTFLILSLNCFSKNNINARQNKCKH